MSACISHLALAARRARLPLIALCASALTAAAALAPPAGATVTEVEKSFYGVQHRQLEGLWDGNLKNLEDKFFDNPVPHSFNNATGDSVLHEDVSVYAVYWDPTFHYHNDWKEVIDGFLQGMGEASSQPSAVFSVDTQYTDKTNQPASDHFTFRGAYSDTSPYPPTGQCADPSSLKVDKRFGTGPLACLTDLQIRNQLQEFVKAHELPKGMNTVYYLLTPPGVTVCLDAGGGTGHCSDFAATELERFNREYSSPSYENSFCSYHSDINPGGSPTGSAATVLYGVIPWTAGGVNDGQLAYSDRTPADYCQAGYWEPNTKEVESRVAPAKVTKTEKEAFEEAKNGKAEKENEEFVGEKEAAILKSEMKEPAEQEPNGDSCAVRGDGFCDRGLSDLIVNQLAVEQQNIVSDPLLNAWMDEKGDEATDECRNFFYPATLGESEVENVGNLYNQTLGQGHYFINDAFNDAAERLNYSAIPCLPGARLEPKFTAPNAVSNEELVAFDGGESDVTLDAGVSYGAKGEEQSNYAKYTWNFGDGTSPVTGYAPGSPPCEEAWNKECAESVFHKYKYGGNYEVTLTVTDVGGNSASETHPITVSGPAAPAPGGGSSGGSNGSAGASSEPASASSQASTSSGSSASSGSQGAGVLAAPTALTSVISSSLPSALSNGLALSYYVNEQVAGRFEVLLNTKLANRLGVAGTPALNLPSGSEPQTVIANALLVTLKGGHSISHIKFSKQTARRLGRLKRLTFEVRLTVHNAATHSPAATTVIGAFTLGPAKHAKKHH